MPHLHGLTHDHRIDTAGLNGFMLFLLFILLIIPTVMMTIPLVFDRWDRMATMNRWLLIPRVAWILFACGSLVSWLAAMLLTISGESRERSSGGVDAGKSERRADGTL